MNDYTELREPVAGRPRLIEEMGLGEVEMRVYQYDNPLRNQFVLKVGIALLELDEQTFLDLRQLVDDYEVGYVDYEGKPTLGERFLNRWKGRNNV